ncbi:hypothetical protein HELRODRAFT_177153 [Helobdella robusta]|uniref:Uncharacterized protein n=1 Tax=Helobdella robusta TaxID=6412 RepID=T1FBA2_HELRO|nr:hypothetical protein HELRODRAFT_177153 [Helobdella robusta]ESN98271.1 hypothetical protein HELRODRAFT_177153 [Helobdella robusta]
MAQSLFGYRIHSTDIGDHRPLQSSTISKSRNVVTFNNNLYPDLKLGTDSKTKGYDKNHKYFSKCEEGKILNCNESILKANQVDEPNGQPVCFHLDMQTSDDVLKNKKEIVTNHASNLRRVNIRRMKKITKDKYETVGVIFHHYHLLHRPVHRLPFE